MKTLIIIGAGSSRDAAHGFKLHKRDLPPLDRDFFEILGHRNISVLQGLLPAVRAVTNHSARWEETSAERVFNYILDRLLGNPDNLSVDRQARLLISTFAQVISETTQSLNSEATKRLARLISSCCKKDCDRVCILTFNYDLLIERAYNQLVESSEKFSSVIPSILYNVPFINDSLEDGRDVQIDPNDLDAWYSFKILKLHGSLNWLHLMNSKRDFRFGAVNKSESQPYFCDLNLPTFGFMPDDCRLTKMPNGPYYWPIIVPPVYWKSAYFGHILKGVWSKAEVLISQADRLIFYGYSFPDSDQNALALFKRMKRPSQFQKLLVPPVSPHEVIILNPDCQTAEYARNGIGYERVKYYKCLDDYLGDRL
jgi:hypothetical protein